MRHRTGFLTELKGRAALLAFIFAILATSESLAAEDCCVIIGIDRHRSVVTAQHQGSGQMFQFVVRDRLRLGTLEIGQAISANTTQREVTVEPACGPSPCPIVTITDGVFTFYHSRKSGQKDD